MPSYGNNGRPPAKKFVPANPYTGHKEPEVIPFRFPNPTGIQNPGFGVKVTTSSGPQYLRADQVVLQKGSNNKNHIGYLEYVQDGEYGPSHHVFKQLNVLKFPLVDLKAKLAEDTGEAPHANNGEENNRGFLGSVWNTCTGIFCPPPSRKRGGQRNHRKTLKRFSKRR